MSLNWFNPEIQMRNRLAQVNKRLESNRFKVDDEKETTHGTPEIEVGLLLGNAG